MNGNTQQVTALLAPTGLSLADALRLILNMDELRRSFFPKTRLHVVADTDIYRMGLAAWQQAHRSVTLRAAAEQYVHSKPYLRPRTLAERRQIFNRISAALPALMKKRLSDLTAEDCHRLLEAPFPTAGGRNKARRHLGGLLRYAAQRGWCSRNNPFSLIPPERLQERTITVLTIPQVEALLAALRQPAYRACTPAVLLMLWGGIRPYEVARLHWEDIDLTERLVYLRPQHTKTGGARQVTVHPVLYRHLRQWLREQVETPLPAAALTPPNWARLWKRLRTAAGLTPWREDTLRHTYASYHLKFFRDPTALQWEMGHRSAEMLRTRYLNMRGLTAAAAAAFWSVPVRCGLSPTPAERRKAQRTAQRSMLRARSVAVRAR